MKKVLLIIGSYIILAFLIIYIVYSTEGDLPPLLEGNSSKYVFLKSMVAFCRLLPALFTSGFLIACASAYSKDAEKAVLPYSNVVIAHFKKLFVTSLVMTFIVFAGYEIIIPGAKQAMIRTQMEPELLDEYLTLGQKAYNDSNYVLAYEYGRQAKLISADNRDVQKLLDKAEGRKDVQRNMIHQKRKESAREVYYDLESKGYSVTQLIKKASDAWKKEKFFECHYWAEHAISLSDSKDINVDDAKRMSAKAWEKLSVPNGLKFTEENQIFADKKKAYMSLNAGNVLDAYYRFLDVQKRLNGMSDPDVDVFLEIARKRVVEQCFFIDETENLDKFESSNDVYFCITHSDESKDVVYIRGVTPVKGTGGLVQYLRGLNIIKYAKDGSFIQSISVPYAKMMAEQTAIFSEDDKIKYDIKDEYDAIPYLMLKSIDRNTSGVVCVPEFKGNNPRDERDLTSYVFAIPYEYFDILCQAGRGEMLMDLASLYQFADEANNYGYSREVFGSALLYRLSIALAMFCILIFAGLMAWNYRISDANQFFKFRWIAIFPISSVAFFFIIEFLFAVLKMFNFALYGFAGSYAILVALVIFAIFAFMLCLTFLHRRAN